MQSDYIKHHGIRGQRLGIRRFQRTDGRLTPAGEKRRAERFKKKEDQKEQKPKKQLTDEQKKAIKIGAVAVSAALVTYGAYKLGQSDKLGDVGLKGSAAIDKLLKRNKGAGDFLNNINDLSISTGFGINSKVLSIGESTAKVNPGYKTGQMEYRNNCFSSVVADIMNRANNGKGLDVVARPASDQELKRGGLSFSDILKPFAGSSVDDIIIKKDNIQNAKSSLSNSIKSICNGEDSYGIIRVKSATNSAQGHYIKWEVSNGECIFSDSLSGSVERADAYLSAIGSGRISRQLEFSRVDGLMVNPNELQNLVKKP